MVAAPSSRRFSRISAAVAASALIATALIAIPASADASVVAVGSHAVQALPQCTATTLATSTDNSDITPIGATYNWHGVELTKFEVADTGALYLISEDASMLAVLVPYSSSTDRSLGGTISYGVGSDGTLCVLWNNIAQSGTDGSARNTFQVLVSPQGGKPGRVRGDFDFSFNYDSIQYVGNGDTNNVGYIPPATTGESTVLLDTPGARTDYLDGQSRALIATSTGSTVPGRQTFSISNPASATATGTLSTSVPTIAGVPSLGATLTATPGAWGPDPVSLDYQWARDGVAIPGAVGATYAVAGADLGHALTVAVTGTKTFYTTATVSSAALPVPAITPAATGTTSVGSKLTATVAGPVPAGSTLSYQWLRSGKAIKGATKATYKLTKSDLKKKISVVVTVSGVGFAPTAITSAKTATIAKPFSKTAKAAISGTAKVGKTLKAKTATWKPKPKFSYQWYSNGTKIAHATKSTYKVTKSVTGTKITVKVTAKKSGYTTTTKTSKASAKVK